MALTQSLFWRLVDWLWPDRQAAERTYRFGDGNLTPEDVLRILHRARCTDKVIVRCKDPMSCHRVRRDLTSYAHRRGMVDALDGVTVVYP